jgi:hypothetical protein
MRGASRERVRFQRPKLDTEDAVKSFLQVTAISRTRRTRPIPNCSIKRTAMSMGTTKMHTVPSPLPDRAARIPSWLVDW